MGHFEYVGFRKDNNNPNPNEPNGGRDENCGVVNRNGGWIDFACSRTQKYICQQGKPDAFRRRTVLLLSGTPAISFVWSRVNFLSIGKWPFIEAVLLRRGFSEKRLIGLVRGDWLNPLLPLHERLRPPRLFDHAQHPHRWILATTVRAERSSLCMRRIKSIVFFYRTGLALSFRPMLLCVVDNYHKRSMGIWSNESLQK